MNADNKKSAIIRPIRFIRVPLARGVFFFTTFGFQ